MKEKSLGVIICRMLIGKRVLMPLLIALLIAGGDSIDKTKANYNSRGTTPVGSYPPNGYGLYDMAGNVWEWVADWYGRNYYKNSPYKNPKGPNSGNSRVLHGGSWDDVADFIRVAYRNKDNPIFPLSYNGFRCARTP